MSGLGKAGLGLLALALALPTASGIAAADPATDDPSPQAAGTAGGASTADGTTGGAADAPADDATGTRALAETAPRTGPPTAWPCTKGADGPDRTHHWTAGARSVALRAPAASGAGAPERPPDVCALCAPGCKTVNHLTFPHVLATLVRVHPR